MVSVCCVKHVGWVQVQTEAIDSTRLHQGPPSMAAAEMAVSKVGGKLVYSRATRGNMSKRSVGRL